MIVHRIKPRVEYNSTLPPSMAQNILFIINAIRKGSEIIKHKRIDIIHTNSFSPLIVGSILSKIHKIPVVATIHDVYKDINWKKWAQENNLSIISSIVGSLFEKICLKMPTSSIHAVSNATKQDLMDFKVKSVVKVIYNGIDFERYDRLDVKKDYKNYVIYIGRLVFYKNLDIVITSFGEVLKKLPDAKFIIVGTGPMRQKWEKLVSELGLDQNIKFTGHISHEKKLELLGQSSALLLPSLVEGFGLVLLEAFAMCKPVLVANVRSYKEIVEEGTDGFMLPAYDIDAWSEKIIFLLRNKTISQKMGCQGRLKAENKFTMHDVADQTESLYFELCSKSKST